MSIRMRLTLWYTGILAVTLIIFGTFLYFSLSSMSLQQYKENLKNQAVQVERRIQVQFVVTLSDVRLQIKLDEIDTLMTENVYLTVINLTNGNVSQSNNVLNLLRNGVVIDFDPKKVTAELEKRQSGFFQRSQFNGYPFLLYYEPIVVQNKLVGVLQEAVLITNQTELLRTIKWLLVTATAAVLLIAFSFGWFMARKALKPIDHVVQATEVIERGEDLSHRIEYMGPHDEIGRLTGKMNSMLARMETAYLELQEAYRVQRRFVSDASHELRTPLTTIRGNVDLLTRIWARKPEQGEMSEEERMAMTMESIHDISVESERMSRLVGDLLSLARADAGYEMDKQPLEVKPMVEEVVRKAQFLPRTSEWRTGSLAALDGVTIQANRDYFQQMLFIFIENAFKYTPEGYVELDAITERERVAIRITDTGIGMRSEEVPQIFERFYRADISRGQTSGTGLGLSIAKWIIEEHGGAVDVKTGVGLGSTFTIWFHRTDIADTPFLPEDGEPPYI